MQKKTWNIQLNVKNAYAWCNMQLKKHTCKKQYRKLIHIITEHWAVTFTDFS